MLARRMTVNPIIGVFQRGPLSACLFTETSRTMASKSADKTSTQPPEKKFSTKLDTIFRKFVTADGSSGFKAEKGRYHLYVSLACPFAHRPVIYRQMKGLSDVVSMTILDYIKKEEDGFNFTDQRRLCELDPINGFKYLSEVYRKVKPDYDGRFNVPVLWDKKTSTIVNNESSDIIRMFNKEFNEFCPTEAQKKLDLSPKELLPKIEETNDWVFPNLNVGVYQCGFARKQEDYDIGVKNLFDALDKAEAILGKQRYIAGKAMTEADIKLFTTLVRFDMVYVGHFKCNKKRIMDYPNLWAYTRDMYQTTGIGETVDKEHIMKHYQMSHLFVNPFGIVAIGPDLDFSTPHGREVM